MLCQFSVSNFQCIKDELTLDMQATNITENSETLLEDVDGEKFLPLCAIYGPNGAGKSTVLHALYSLGCKIMRPICAAAYDDYECLKGSSNVLIHPFKFSKETIYAPTKYELFFRTQSYEYQYVLWVAQNKVVQEELYKKALSGYRYALVFSRKKGSLELKGSFKNYSCADISDNLPLLSYFGMTHRRNAIVKDIIDWFDNSFNFINYGDPEVDARIAVVISDDLKDLVLKMLREMDIDITDYRVEENDDRLKVFTTHTVTNQSYELSLTEESNGTMKIFSILPFIAQSLLYGRTLVVDELDAKLHPLLLKYIIRLYNDPEINKNKAQLIFTSHDLSTMNNENFRRDEIWFIAKGSDQSAKMYSLIEFKKPDGTAERKDAKYDKHYLEGRYGADPYLRRIIDWGKL